MLDLDRLADVEQRLGLEFGPDARSGVEEVRLVEDLADRLGLVDRGDGLDGDPVLGEVGDGAAQVLLALAHVRAEPDVPDPGRGTRRSDALALVVVLALGRALQGDLHPRLVHAVADRGSAWPRAP